jgi:hypothetical protein
VTIAPRSSWAGLARVLQAEPAWVRGQTVLDLGCGSGVAGIVALYAGTTRVVAHDIDPMALATAAKVVFSLRLVDRRQAGAAAIAARWGDAIRVVYLGAVCEKEGWREHIHRKKRCDVSLFQLGLRLLEHFLNEELPIPVQFHVTI